MSLALEESAPSVHRVPPGWRRRRTGTVATIDNDVDPGAIDGGQVYKRNMYLAGQLSTLMSRYVRIRGDLLIEYARLANDEDLESNRAAVRVCRGLLSDAKQELESRNPSPSRVVNLLGLAERMLVTLYRQDILNLRIQTIIRQLEMLDPRPSDQITALQDRLTGSRTDERAAIETTLKDAISFVNACEERELLEDDLQVSRLSRLRWYLVCAWLLLLIAIPVVSSVQTVNGELVWPVVQFGSGEHVDLLSGAVGLSIVGAVGGVVSGMLNVRDSRATMLCYRTSLKRLALKPLVGAVAALVVYLFLGAQMISGIEITSPGTYVVLAFVAGFSERYFLSVLSTPSDAKTQLLADSRSSTRIPADTFLE